MELILYRLYLITVYSRLKVGHQPVALIPGKDPLGAINKYLSRIGFDSDYKYFCSHLMTTSVTVMVNTNDTYRKCYFDTTGTKTSNGDFIGIDSLWVIGCDNVFSLVGPTDINSPLFMRPTIKEVRNCIGFDNDPESELRKFCR